LTNSRSPAEPLVLGLDVGTSRIKAALVDARGDVVGEPCVRATPLQPDGLLEQTSGVIDEVIDPKGPPISAVAVSCFWHGLMFTDRAGRPRGSISTWQDPAPSGLVRRLQERLDPADYHRRTGCFLHPSYPFCRLDPDEVARLPGDTLLLGPADWLVLCWLGEAVTSPSMASGTGLTRVGGIAYDDEVLGLARLDPGRVPAIGIEPVSGLVGTWAERWPALRTVPWYLPVGDGVAETIGSGCTVGNRAALKLGTSAAARVLVDPIPEPPDELFTYAATSSVGLVGGALSNAGNLIAWARNSLGVDDDAVARAMSRPYGAHGLKVDPSLAGERSLGWPIQASGRIEGLSLSTTAIDVLQGLLEAATDNLVAVVDALEKWNGGTVELVASGGVLERHPAWVRRICERLDRAVYGAPATHTGVRGAALLALADLGIGMPATPLGEPLF
jgi:gluconokinase